jgi:DNA-binding beta-propeller fold protein YncE
MRIALLALTALLLGSVASAAPRPTLALPYGVLVDGAGRVFVADAGRHRVFRYDAARRRLVAVAGTGRAGTSGDGGPALRARLGEIVSLAQDRAGRLYVSDVHAGVVRRFRIGGRIETVARIAAPTGIDVDPSGRFLAVASIERGVLRVELASGALTTLVARGDGVEGPHGLAYDANGNLWVADPPARIIRLDAQTGRLSVAARVDTANVLPTAAGVYFTAGSMAGGRVRLLTPTGTVRTIVGTGRISTQRDGVRATRVGILPTGIAQARNGTLLVAQSRPVPALRRVSRRGIITTLTR